MSESSSVSASSTPNESDVCESCGHFGASEFGDRKLCPNCYANSGSCCPEFDRQECSSGNS